MKKIILIFSAIVVLFSLPLAVKGVSEKDWGANVYIPVNQTIEDNYVRVGNTFDIRGTIEGDLIVGASNLEVSGKVTGDVIAAASNIKISGEVAGDVRVAGGTVSIDGKVGKNVNIFAGTADLGPDSEILGHLSVWAGTVGLKGLIEGGVYGGARTVLISGKIGRDTELRFDGENQLTGSFLTVSSEAEIGGNFNYYSKYEAEIEEGSVIAGTVTKHQPTELGKVTRGLINSIWWIAQIANFFGLIIVGLVVVWVFGRKTKEITCQMTKNTGKKMLLGLAIIIIVPIVGFILISTLIGFPLGLIILLLYGILLYLCPVFFAVFLGEKIILAFRKKKKDIPLSLALLVGVIIYVVVVDFILWSGSPLGFISGLIKFLIVLWVLGAVFYPNKKIEKNAKSK